MQAISLHDQFKKMDLGDHLCLIYENPRQQMAAIVPFIQQGLERNESCVYITDDLSIEEVQSYLKEAGIEVEQEVQRGALQFATKREAYLASGEFDPRGMIEFLRQAVEETLEKGFSGFRVTGEMTWALGECWCCDRLIEYESLLNEFFPGSKAIAICQYNRKRFPADVIRNVLRTHPIAIIDDEVCSNLFYEPPKMVLGEETTEVRVDWMLQQLKRFSQTEHGLQQAIKSRDEFLGMASHELKTPLTSLMLEAQSIKKLLEKGDRSELFFTRVKKVMNTTDTQVRRLSKLVDDLLDVSRINEGKLGIHPEKINLNTLVSTVIERFAEEFKTKNIEISSSFQGNIYGEWDRFRLEQVLINLLSNAIKYGDGSPIEVKCKLKSTSEAEVQVKDFGKGIHPEKIDKIFDRFERAHLHHDVSGLGLGLYISKQIVESHQGTLTVDGIYGKETTFQISLPLEQA